MEAFRLARASWWAGDVELGWLPVWLPRCWKREVVVSAGAGHSWLSKVEITLRI